MYYYKIGYSAIDENKFVVLMHDNYYSKEKLAKIFAQIIIKRNLGITFRDCFWNIIHILVKEYGFKRKKYDCVWNIFGLAEFGNDLSWTWLKKEENKLLNEELYEQSNNTTRFAGKRQDSLGKKLSKKTQSKESK